MLWTSEGELRVFGWASQQQLTEEFSQDSDALSSQVSFCKLRALLLTAV